MTVNLLLPLLLLAASQASHYYGTVMTFTPKDIKEDGSVRVGTTTIKSGISLIFTCISLHVNI